MLRNVFRCPGRTKHGSGLVFSGTGNISRGNTSKKFGLSMLITHYEYTTRQTFFSSFSKVMGGA